MHPHVTHPYYITHLPAFPRCSFLFYFFTILHSIIFQHLTFCSKPPHPRMVVSPVSYSMYLYPTYHIPFSPLIRILCIIFSLPSLVHHTLVLIPTFCTPSECKHRSLLLLVHNSHFMKNPPVNNPITTLFPHPELSPVMCIPTYLSLVDLSRVPVSSYRHTYTYYLGLIKPSCVSSPSVAHQLVSLEKGYLFLLYNIFGFFVYSWVG